MAKARRRLDEVAWRRLLAEQAASRLSVVRFCAREGVSAASFHRWRSRLGHAVQEARRESAASSAFVDLGALGGGGRFELRLELGGGLVLQLARG